MRRNFGIGFFSMPKKYKIGSEAAAVDFTVINITCQKADYWMAYQMNEVLPYNFRRASDFEISYTNPGIKMNYALFYNTNADHNEPCYLLANHHPDGKLIPQQKASDYFLVVSGKIPDSEKNHILSRIKKIPFVLTAYCQESEGIKTIRDIVADLEIHLIHQNNKVA